LTEADFCLGVSSLFVGQLAEARERLTQSVVRSEGQCGRDLALSDGRNPRIVSLAHLAQALWLCGYPDQAVRASQEALAAARAAGHPFGLTYALLAASWVFQLRRDADASCALAADAIALAAEEDLPAFLAMATILRASASIDGAADEQAAAAAEIHRALAAYRATGAEIARPYLLGLQAEVHEAAAETEQALGVLAEAAEVARTTGERWYEPEIRRREGELLLRQSITNRRVASARFCQAIAVANQQGGRSLELRAAVSLARLWSDLGRRAQAQDLLAPVYDWFKEGFDTADLVAAKALLEELS
jgi:predicted ATPase